LHISITKVELSKEITRTKEIKPLLITDDDIEEAKNAVLIAGGNWPEQYSKAIFTLGPFAGTGMHVWEK
jgi:hypothetical protein